MLVINRQPTTDGQDEFNVESKLMVVSYQLSTDNYQLILITINNQPTTNMKIAVFPGSFDPITLGHYDIVERAAPLFDKIIIAIGKNSQKKYMFSLEQREAFIRKTFENFPNVEVDSFEGLTIDYCRSKNVNFILRGLRNPADFEFEKAIAQTNRTLTQENKIETIFLLTSAGKSFISSSIVREIINFGGDYTLLVPDAVRI